MRRLRFAVTPRQLGQKELTHRSLWPQYLVITLNALAVPVGVLLFVREAALPPGAMNWSDGLRVGYRREDDAESANAGIELGRRS